MSKGGKVGQSVGEGNRAYVRKVPKAHQRPDWRRQGGSTRRGGGVFSSSGPAVRRGPPSSGLGSTQVIIEVPTVVDEILTAEELSHIG